jgi:hypothetical protein
MLVSHRPRSIPAGQRTWPLLHPPWRAHQTAKSASASTLPPLANRSEQTVAIRCATASIGAADDLLHINHQLQTFLS